MGEFREVRKGILTKIDELNVNTTILTFLFGDSYIEIPFYGKIDENLDYEEAVLKEMTVFPGPTIYQELHIAEKIFFGSADRRKIKAVQREEEERKGYWLE